MCITTILVNVNRHKYALIPVWNNVAVQAICLIIFNQS